MNKAILMSIQPKWVAKILNGEKTIEIRKKFPKDYVGWVYIYCTKAKPYLYDFRTEKVKQKYFDNLILNGKVVARFWCDKVEEIKYTPYDCTFYTDTLDTVICADTPVSSFEKASGLSYFELHDYLYNGKEKVGYAIHISKLEVFDKPKELKEFKPYTCDKCNFQLCSHCNLQVKKAPQSYMFIEDTQ